MMSILAKGLGAVFGKYAGTISLPLMFFVALIMGHQWWVESKAREEAEAVNICNATWKAEVRKQERDAAQRELLSAQELLAGERLINEGLQNDLQKLRERIASVAPAAAGSDPRCLSDGVLNLLGGHERIERPAPRRPSVRGSRSSEPAAGPARQ
jgi:hypothetical protein